LKPASKVRRATWEPMKPVAPVIRTRDICEKDATWYRG
jgi:hypothetical protein